MDWIPRPSILSLPFPKLSLILMCLWKSLLECNGYTIKNQSLLYMLPKLSHKWVVKKIAQYLLGTKDKGITFRADPSRGLECFPDVNFAGGWERGDSDTQKNVTSCTWYIILYVGCPIVWCSKFQTEIALLTMEAEYIALSQALHDVIPLTNLMQELQMVIPFYNPTANSL